MFKMCQCGLKPDAVTNSKGGISQISRRRNEEKGAQNMLSLRLKGTQFGRRGIKRLDRWTGLEAWAVRRAML